jgi:hypothetical protein
VGGLLNTRFGVGDGNFADSGGFRWPKFMTKPKGQKLQRRIWEETRGVLEGYAPEVAAIYACLSGTEKASEK